MEEEPQDSLRDQISDLSQLVRSRGWARLASIAEAQAKTRTANVLSAGGGDEKEFQKGEIAGIRLFMQLPETALANLKQQLEEEQRNDDQSET